MSVSMYRSQVDRLRKEIADLEKRAADERRRASTDRNDALRTANSITKSTSASLARSKLRQVQAKESNAAAHDKKAADLADRAASKSRQLSSAQNSLDHAVAQQRRRDEADARRRRDDELRHIELLESRRRAAMTDPLATRNVSAERHEVQQRPQRAQWDVCLSYAGEDRAYVEMVAAALKARNLRVFYDQDEQGTLWGKDLAEHFDYVYRVGSRYCVMFISEAYAKKQWTRHERRSALARAVIEEGEYVLPARVDDTELDGLRPTVAYLDLRTIAPETLVEFIVEKVRGAR